MELLGVRQEFLVLVSVSIDKASGNYTVEENSGAPY